MGGVSCANSYGNYSSERFLTVVVVPGGYRKRTTHGNMRTTTVSAPRVTDRHV